MKKIVSFVIIVGVLVVLCHFGYNYFLKPSNSKAEQEITATEPSLFVHRIIPLATVHTSDTPPPPSEPHPQENVSYTQPSQHTLNSSMSDDDEEDPFMRLFKDGYIYDKFTIVMPTYKRTENLFPIMDQYCPYSDIIDKILILWNNIGRPIPNDLSTRAKSCQLPVIIRVMERNNLTSRFFPYSQIRTAGVLSLDDDNLIEKPSLELAFRTFQKYPHRLVGYDARSFSIRAHNRIAYSFRSQPYHVVLTNRGFIHYKYLQMFSKIPTKVRDFVIEHKNGEDLAMNMVIGQYLKEMDHPQCVGVHVKTTIKALNNYSKEKYGGLSRRSSHISDRHKCFQLLADVYGDLRDYLPECNLVISDIADL